MGAGFVAGLKVVGVFAAKFFGSKIISAVLIDPRLGKLPCLLKRK
jgi:hypothetical protein